MTTGVLAIGPSLAVFPAFPESFDPFALGLTADTTSLSFSINGYDFVFEGDFDAVAGFDLPDFLAALDPANPASPPIAFEAVTVRETGTGVLAIALDGPETPPLAFNAFLGILLDPRNFTDDILTAFYGDVADFTTLDLSAFETPVFMAKPNAAVTGPAGVIGVQAFASELDGFVFDRLVGGAGDDRLGAPIGGATVEGLGGDDVLIGDDGPDHLVGGAGDDVLVGGRDDVLDGGEGADVFVLPGRVLPTVEIVDFSPEEGDRIAFALPHGPFASNVTVAASGTDALVRIGDQGRDFVFGAEGDDFLFGADGPDLLAGRRGDDVVWGGAGDDRLRGGAGDDFLDGGRGDDVVNGGVGANTLTGGDGADRFVFTRPDGELDRITDFDIGLDLIDLRRLLEPGAADAELTDLLRLSAPAPTELFNFVEVDPDGPAGPDGFTPVFRVDDVPDEVVLDPATYLW